MTHSSPDSVTDAMVEAAASVMWNDRDARQGGPWESRDPQEVVVIQTKATARAALEAALRIAPAQAAGGPPITDLTFLKQQSERLSVEDQHALAEFIAPNLGMVLVAEPTHPDDPHRDVPQAAKPVAWRYQMKEGWDGIWRVVTVYPTFEFPENWRVEPLYTAHAQPQAAATADDLRAAYPLHHALNGVLERTCQKCGIATKGEEALVDGKIWCHPCADNAPQAARTYSEQQISAAVEKVISGMLERGELVRGHDVPQVAQSDLETARDILSELGEKYGISDQQIVARWVSRLRAPPQAAGLRQEEDCGCIGAVIGQHERSCPLSHPVRP